jgi:hypothetical protein
MEKKTKPIEWNVNGLDAYSIQAIDGKSPREQT